MPIFPIKAVTWRLDNRNSPERDVTKPIPRFVGYIRFNMFTTAATTASVCYIVQRLVVYPEVPQLAELQF